MTKNPGNKKINYFFIIFRILSIFWAAVGLMCAVVWVSSSWIPYDISFVVGTFSLNTLGDFLAGWFAPLAFFWLTYTVILQKNELILQREELSLQRNELEGTKQALEDQVKIFEHQNIDTTFFKLIDCMHTASAKINHHSRTGNDAINHFLTSYTQNPQQNIDLMNDGKFQCNQFIDTFQYILRYLNNATLLNNSDDKIHYIKILISQITIHEKVLLLYFSQTPDGEILKEQIIKYELFTQHEVNHYLNDFCKSIYTQLTNQKI